MEILIILSLLFYTGLLFYFRYTDARNITIRSLQDTLKKSEKQIQFVLKKKEKEFEDRMISSEIVIERMTRIASTLQEKLDIFDTDLIEGQDLYDNLKQEIGDVAQELHEYKQIRFEFKDIEDRISSILDMKQQAQEGTEELANLRFTMKQQYEDYQLMAEELKQQSREELNSFFHEMQSDLSTYLTKAKQQLSEKDNEMASQINELKNASDSMAERIREFKDYAQHSVESLKLEYNNDLEMAQAISQTSLNEIYDLWTELKENTQNDKLRIENDMETKEQFFKETEQQIRAEVEAFKNQIENLSKETHTNFELNMEEKLHLLDTKIINAENNLDSKGNMIKSRIEQELNGQIIEVREELEKIQAAFTVQEATIKERLEELGIRIGDALLLGENSFQDSILDLKKSVDDIRSYSDNILISSRDKIEFKIIEFEDSFKEQAQSNMKRIEESFRNENQEKMLESIRDITMTLETEYKQKYQDTIESIFEESQNLDAKVKEKLNYINNLDSRLQEILDSFHNEKDKILLMVTELEKDRDTSTQTISHQINEYTRDMQNSMQVALQDFYNQGSEDLTREREIWQERYDETLKEARDSFISIQHEIDEMRHFINNLENTSLTNLKHESERFIQDTERRVEDLKRYTSEYIRSSRDDFQHQTDHAKQEIKNLKQELWNQEKEVRDIAQKDFERLNLRVKDVDKQFQNFIKKSERLERAEELMNKLSQRYNEIVNLKQEMQQLSNNLKETEDKGKITLNEMNNFRNDLENQSTLLTEKSNEANRLQEYLLSTIDEAKNVSQLFQGLNKEKDQAYELEKLLLKNLEQFNDLQEALNQLENRKVMVDKMNETIDVSGNNIISLSNSSEELVQKITEISVYTEELQEKLGMVQSGMRELAGDQTQIRSVVSKFHDLEHISAHIDAEMKRLEKMRDWIAKAMNNIKRTGIDIDSKNENESLEDANVKNILRLYDQSWSISEIAKNLKLSTAYVELILERYRA